jgi:hypothetical protein
MKLSVFGEYDEFTVVGSSLKTQPFSEISAVGECAE